MKKSSKIIIILLLITITLSTIILMPRNFKSVEENAELKSLNNSMLSIMLGTEIGGTEYVESTITSFPQKYYSFNPKLSKCINGSKLKYNEDTKTVNVETAKTDKCYAYFDKTTFTIKYDFTGNYETFVVPVDGEYKIELWGASGGSGGGDIQAIGGKGAYVKGNIKLVKDEKLYIYVGEYPIHVSNHCYETNPNSSFNGSRTGACDGGGGATDVRLIDGEWDNFDGLKSRIMVAAGGGGAQYKGFGGYGGGLVGGNAEGYSTEYADHAGYGATQESFEFGVSGGSTCVAGNGYYSGEKGNGANAGGGSSFISGYPGCNAIAKSSTKDNIIHTGEPIHYSGKVFTDMEMIAGNEEMPKPDGGTEVGHTGNGYARITLVK